VTFERDCRFPIKFVTGLPIPGARRRDGKP
jgi:hypothetical protein